MNYRVIKKDFGVYEIKSLEGLKLNGFYSIINEKDNISLICEKINNIHGDNFLSIDEGYYLVSVEIQYNPNITGILAKISSKLSKEGISFYVITTYNFGHFLISKNLLTKAETVFKEMKY